MTVRPGQLTGSNESAYWVNLGNASLFIASSEHPTLAHPEIYTFQHPELLHQLLKVPGV